MTFPFNALLTYFDSQNQTDKLDSLFERVRLRNEMPTATYGLALSHYQAGRLQEALRVLDQSKWKERNQDHLRVFVLAELFPNDPRPARQAFESLVAQETTGLSTYEDMHCLCFLGYRAEAIERCRKLREKHGDRAVHSSFHRSHLAYFCGDTDESSLTILSAFSRNTNSASSFYIALNYLADGDRANALKYFRKGTSYPLTAQTQFWWSKVFLSRMEKDPTWPPWIRGKK